MATITTNTFLDSGTARTAGETWEVNGCTFTIRTDTRWHAGSPASMTGSLGQISTDTANSGKIVFDARNVRWLPFDSGTGTVPAIGSTITQGGVSGYLLGVWADYVSAPTAVGAAMPTTGYLKFREVSGGTFAVGALTGISANATAPDAVGWIEIVGDNGGNMCLSGNANSKFDTYGDWFKLGTTSGTPGQVVQLPTNGGGSGTTVSAIQIETAPGSGEFEWYQAVATSVWLTTVLNTDVRSKYVQYVSNGQVRIGSDGTTNIGYTPVAGCVIRVPNIFLRGCATATRSQNSSLTSLTSRPRLNVGSQQVANFRNLCSDWYITCSNIRVFNMENSCWDAGLTLTQIITSSTFTNCANGFPQSISVNAVSISGQYTPVTVNGMKLARITSSMCFNISDAGNMTINNLETGTVFNRTSTMTNVNISIGKDISFTNLKLRGGRLFATTIQNLNINGVDYIDRLSGATTASGPNSVISLTLVNDSLVSGVSFGMGTLDFTNCYDRLFITSQCKRVKFRNCGTLASPLLCGNNASFYPNGIHYSTSVEEDLSFQRIYIGNTRGANFNHTSYSNRITMENIGGGYAGAYQLGVNDVRLRSTAIQPPNSSSSVAGSHFYDGFTSPSAGFLTFFFSTPSQTSTQYVTTNFTNTLSGFSGQGDIFLRSVGEYVILETPYTILGHSSFANTAITFASPSYLANMSVQYQIDTGSGYGAWKTLNLTNLLAETISASVGFKMRLKVTCTTANANNSLRYVTIASNSTTTDRNNTYPLDTSTLSFTGLIPGSEVRCYTGSDPATAIEIGGTESSGSTFSFSHSSGGTVGFIRIFALGYQPLSIDPYTYSTSDTSLLIQQVVDRNYVNP